MWGWAALSGALASAASLGVCAGRRPVARRLAALTAGGVAPARGFRRRSRSPGSRSNGGDVGLPLLLDLLAAALDAGASPSTALTAVADALPAGLSGPLRPVATALSLGAAPAHAWALVLGDLKLRPLAVAMSRASTSGVHIAELLRAMATDARGRRRAAATEAARRAGVRAVLPLGVCFLPAFVLLGIAPTIAGLASSALGSR